jgi:protein-S-isoprenylcysteine O-methyltransferase Ste14
LLGLTFAFWSIHSEFTKGEGTPAPMMPTQKLVITGPFRYCRNPMTFGTICGYLGVVVLTGSLSSLILYALLVAILITFIKLAEEKELAIRFGQDYLDYKQSVPFIIPRLW